MHGYASGGLGSFSAGPEFDVHYTFYSSDDPAGWDWSAGIGHGKGTGARIEGYVQGNFTFKIIILKEK